MTRGPIPAPGGAQGSVLPRLAYIDLFRGVAVLAMVETHVVNAFLRLDLRATGWFKALDFVNGLVAPAFLFIAGYAFALVAGARWDGLAGLGRPFWKQLRRIAVIWVVAYWLHIPQMSLPGLLAELDPRRPHLFWRVDVLHVIAFSLLLALLLLVVCRRPLPLAAALAALASLVVFLTPAVLRLPPLTAAPVPLTAYFNNQIRSTFPLFPWAAFLLAGAVAGLLAGQARRRGREKEFFRRLAAAGLALTLVSLLAPLRPLQAAGAGVPWKETPAGFFTRLGLVLLLLCLGRAWEAWLRGRPTWVAVAGQESLPVYVVHLQIVYGSYFGGHSLSYLVGKTCPPLGVAIMASALVALMVALAVAWNRLKRRRPVPARRLLQAFAALVVIVLLLKPG